MEILKYESGLGEHVRVTAERMLSLARRNKKVQATFNGVDFVVSEFSTIETIVSHVERKIAEAAEKYSRSPEALRELSRQEALKYELERKADYFRKARLPAGCEYWQTV